MKASAFSLRYLVAHQGDIHAQFDVFCKAAWQAGNVVMFVDELPEVTKANKAPPAWRRRVNVGRDYSGADGKRRWLSIIGAGQRPAECDKSFIANADVIHTGRLAHQTDARELAASLGCDFRDLLQPVNGCGGIARPGIGNANGGNRGTAGRREFVGPVIEPKRRPNA